MRVTRIKITPGTEHNIDIVITGVVMFIIIFTAILYFDVNEDGGFNGAVVIFWGILAYIGIYSSASTTRLEYFRRGKLEELE